MRVHFIAIGGSAMHNLAMALHHKGYQVTGSDDIIFDPSKSRLQKLGLLPETFGWYPDKITKEIDAVILGMHAKADNPELLKAQELDLNIYSYPEYLFEQSKSKTRVVIGGSHGKTTITSMVLHVMHYLQIDVDYMVGAQLEGFETMVRLTEENDFIILEGDEYLSSPIDRRPKFHLYQPNIALISGIAWDHINVFPTFENYVEQFKIFIDQITPGGILVYNQEDKTLQDVVGHHPNQIRKIPYTTAAHTTQDQVTYLETPEGAMPVAIFGRHNLNNVSGAKWICQQMGVDEADFYEAIASFRGASKRLEKIIETDQCTVFKDFAHSPSKVKATSEAVKSQYPDHTMIACLELHTYSSLNPEFIKQYKDTLKGADLAVVYYSSKALEIKKLPPISEAQIREAFNKEGLMVYTDKEEFLAFVYGIDYKDTVLLMMSSGNYGGVDFNLLEEKMHD